MKSKSFLNSISTPAQVYYYQAFGLTIESTIICPGQFPQEGAPDVTIRYLAVPEILEEVKAQGISYRVYPPAVYQINSEAVLLTFDSIGRYLVRGGKEILVDPASGAHEDEIRLLLFGFVFGVLLLQRGLLPLHGSAIEVKGGAMVLMGPFRSGKSTLAAALHQRGYRIMADDICALSTSNEGPPLVFSGPPQIKLWADVVKNLGKDPLHLPRIKPNLEKYWMLLREGFCEAALPLGRIYELFPTDTQEVGITPLKGMEKVTPIIKNTYRREFLDGLGRRKVHFEQCLLTARHALVNRLTRPKGLFLLDELVDILEKDWA